MSLVFSNSFHPISMTRHLSVASNMMLVRETLQISFCFSVQVLFLREKEIMHWPDMVVHICYTSYLGGRGRRIIV
jgi:hypothetical protein